MSDMPLVSPKDLVRTYHSRAYGDTWKLLKFRQERSPSYLRVLARLIEDVSGAPVSVSEHNVTLSVAATRAVCTGDRIGD